MNEPSGRPTRPDFVAAGLSTCPLLVLADGRAEGSPPERSPAELTIWALCESDEVSASSRWKPESEVIRARRIDRGSGGASSIKGLSPAIGAARR